MERLDGLLGVTPIAIGDLILVRVQSFWQEKNLASARQLFRSLAPLSRRGARHGWKAPENPGSCAAAASRCARWTTGSAPRPAIAARRLDGYEANLPLLFSDRDFLPYVEQLGLEAA